jgi:biofilm PGA synthesis N-glycosyltransferase PgaC
MVFTIIWTIPYFILAVAGVCLVTLFSYYFYFFQHFNKMVISETATATVPISVIIAARNERKNLEKNLDLWLTQNYSNYEIVLINDGSHDGTKALLKEYTEKYAHLKVVTLELDERYQKGKKFALTMGIKAAKYEHLLFTDADCAPASNLWIRTMSGGFQTKEIVLGVSPLTVKKNLLGSIIRYENFHTSLQYLSYAARENIYMGVGRNMAYTKSLFFANKGFASHQHILSGDDDLFVQQTAKPGNTAICINKESFTYSDAPATLKQWITQKARHMSTSKLYKPKYKRLLGGYSLVQILFYLSCIVYVFVCPAKWYFVLALLSLKWLIQWIIMYKPAKLLDAKSVAQFLPFYDLLYTLYLFCFGIMSPFIRITKWK